jgi:transposase
MDITTDTEEGDVTVGVDTHDEIHVAAVIDRVGRELGWRAFPANPTGYTQLWDWVRGLGAVTSVGVEGTGAYGAGLTRFLLTDGATVIEVDRPDRKARRRHGKSDPLDAYAAARAVLSRRATCIPKSRDGHVEMIRTLRIARRSALKARTQATNQLKSVIKTGPADLREELRDLSDRPPFTRCARLRPGPMNNPRAASKATLRRLAKRILALTEELAEIDDDLEQLVTATAATLLGLPGVGIETAAQLLVTAGDNPQRLTSEAAFAHLCGAAPIPASSGKTTRHRLNRGGDRQANSALWRIAMSRLRWDPHTQAYATRRTTEGRSKREIIRCLKRFIARQVYHAIRTDLGVPEPVA